MDEIKINMIEKTDEGLVLKLPTTSVEQVKGLKESLDKKVDKVEGKQLSTNDYSTEEKNKLSKLNNYDDTNIKADIAKKADTSTVNTNLAKKVDKVSGKGLSTNDYTDLEKSEVAKIKNLATNETVEGIKSEVETLKTSKVDKVVGKGLSTNDYNNVEKAEVAKVKNKADTTYVDEQVAQAGKVDSVNGKTGIVVLGANDIRMPDGNAVSYTVNRKANITDLDLKIDKTSITSDLKGTDKSKVLSQEAGNELNKKFDTIGSSRSATIVIANYNSTEKSKKGADYVVKKGEDASKVIMNAEQELVGFGGKILLLEGNYDCQSSIVLGYADSILEGCGAVLVQNTNWSETSYNGKTSKHFINNPSDFKSVIIKNLVLKGAKITGSNGIYCRDSSQVSNCTVSGSGSNGIYCTGSSQVNNCTISGSGNDGIFCTGSFVGVCAFNTLKGCTLKDNSSSPAKVEYNIIQ